MTPTPEQLAIIEAATTTEDNLLLSALAGAAKTSTLVLIAEALPNTEMLCLSFNKKIATEMQERLPRNCTAMTLNSLGHRTWSEAIGKRLRIEVSKTYDILKPLIEGLPSADRGKAYSGMADLMRTIDFGKACGYVPTGQYERAKRLMNDDEFFAHLDEDPEGWECDLIRASTLESLRQALDGLCDYNDQILMPTVFHGAFPRYPLVLVDEAQDLSALNHATLRKLARKRLICVGDSCQAIYGFRGAHEESMDLLRETFAMRELPLSISFRCPTSIVKHVQWRAPSMQWPSWAAEGEVRRLSTWTADDLSESAAVICRNNAPLFSLAIKLLARGRAVEITRNDIGKSLLKVMKKFGSSSLSQDEVLRAIADWKEAKLAKAKHRAKAGIEDRAACLAVFAQQGKDLGDAIAYAEHLFNSRAPLKLMTGHGSKGLEFDEVYFLDSHLVGDEGQERNLRYVICTRAKKTLTYIDLEDFDG